MRPWWRHHARPTTLRRVLDHDGRAGDAEVGCAALGRRAVPRQGGLAQTGLDLGVARRRVLVVDQAGVVADQLQQGRLLGGGHLRSRQPLGLDRLAVLPRAEHQVDRGAAQDRRLLLRGIQRGHQRERLVLDVAERADRLAAGIGIARRLRADEGGGQRHVRADDRGVDRHMVPAPLPLPRAARRRCPDQGEVVVLHAEIPAAAPLLRGQGVVGGPLGPDAVVALSAQGGLHQRQPGILGRGIEVAPHQAGPFEPGRGEIGPALLLRGVDPVEEPGLLLGIAQRGHEGVRRGEDRGRRILRCAGRGSRGGRAGGGGRCGRRAGGRRGGGRAPGRGGCGGRRRDTRRCARGWSGARGRGCGRGAARPAAGDQEDRAAGQDAEVEQEGTAAQRTGTRGSIGHRRLWIRQVHHRVAPSTASDRRQFHGHRGRMERHGQIGHHDTASPGRSDAPSPLADSPRAVMCRSPTIDVTDIIVSTIGNNSGKAG